MASKPCGSFTSLSLVFQPGSGGQRPPKPLAPPPLPRSCCAHSAGDPGSPNPPPPTSPLPALRPRRQAGWSPLPSRRHPPTQHRARGPGVHDGHMGTSAELDEQRGPRAATRQRGSFHKGGWSWGPLTPGRQAGGRDVLSRPSIAMSFLPAPGLPGAPRTLRPLQPTRVAAEATGSAPSLQVLPPDNPESDLPTARKPSKDPGPASTSTKAHPGLGGLVSTQMRSGVRARQQDGTRDG